MADDEQPQRARPVRLVPPGPADPGGTLAEEPGTSRSGSLPDDWAVELEAYRFPPLPLLSGTAVVGGDGALRPIAGVTVVVTALDGSEHAVALEPRHGGWWPPRDD